MEATWMYVYVWPHYLGTFPWVGLGPIAHRYQYHPKNLCRMLQQHLLASRCPSWRLVSSVKAQKENKTWKNIDATEKCQRSKHNWMIYLEKALVPLLYFVVIELCIGTEVLKLLRLELAVLLTHEYSTDDRWTLGHRATCCCSQHWTNVNTTHLKYSLPRFFPSVFVYLATFATVNVHHSP